MGEQGSAETAGAGGHNAFADLQYLRGAGVE
jgi:hypothetical protein